MFCRGWYQKSYMNSKPSASRSQRSATEKSRASSTANPPGALPSASPSIEIVMMSPGMQCTVCGALSPSFSLISSPSITFLIRGRARVGDVEDVDPRGADSGHDQRVAPQLRVARRRAGVPAEVVQLVADVRHVGAPDDLRRSVDDAGSTSTTAMKSGRSIPVPSYSAAT